MAHAAENPVGKSAHGANVSVLRHHRNASDQGVVHHALRIENFRHIQRAYGQDAAQAALGDVTRMLADLVRGHARAVADRRGTINVHIVTTEDGHEDGAMAVCRPRLEAFRRLIPLQAFPTRAGPVHLWLSGCGEKSDSFVGREDCTDGTFCGLPAGEGDKWAERYRADMTTAARLLPHLAPSYAGHAEAEDGRSLAFCWQAVHDAGEPDRVLYHEALARLVAPDGSVEMPDDLFPALERLGFARLVDHHVVAKILDELEASPDAVLGVNISAQSARLDHGWKEIQARLRRAPDIAQRLVIEITETAVAPDITGTVHFSAQIRRLGCKIALDDFGTGHASIRQLIALAPDFVKIDRFFVRRCASSNRDRELLAHIIGVARSLGSAVIVEGVETPEQADLIRAAGGMWQQGYHWSRPSFYRPWLVARQHLVTGLPIGATACLTEVEA